MEDSDCWDGDGDGIGFDGGECSVHAVRDVLLGVEG